MKKNKISEFEATATLPDKLYVGMNLYDPNLLETISFNTTKGAPARLDADSPWMYYNEETGYYERIYKNDDAQIVKAGVRYAYAAQLRIDGVDYETNTLAHHVDVKINGVLWNTSEDPYKGSTVTYTWTQSPDFEVSSEPYRQKISRISATVYDYQNTYFYGDPIVLPSSYTVTVGIPAKFDDTTDVWQKKNGDTWEDCTENTFKGGTYRLKVKLVVDGEDNDTHYLNDGIWGAINGTTMSSRYWHSLDTPTHTANSSYVWMVSPEHIIEGPASYTVAFDANGGTGNMASVNNVSGSYTLPPNGFTPPANKQFKAWSVGGVEKAVGSTINVIANTTVTAIWEAIEYNVTVTGGTASVGAGTPITKATMGTTVTLTAGAAPTGQMFDKWVVNGATVADANSATTTFVMPAGEVTATATYKNISVGNHPVTIAMKDGDDVNSTYTDVQSLALELLVYKGLLVEDAQVTGYRNNAGKLLFTINNTLIDLQEGLTEQDYIHYTLTPQEVADIKSYYKADITEVHLTFPSKCVVSFETNGGSSVSKLNLYIGDKVTKPADPTKPYFAFAGWYSDSGLTQEFDFNQPITGDITLYAKWTPSPVNGMFLMTIDFNGGTSTMPTVSEVPANSGIYLNDNLGNFVTPPSGKVLAGYEIDGVPYAAGGDYLVTQNFTLKFLWKDAPVTTYTVSFNANGGTGTMADVTGISGEYTLPENGFTAPTGKQFKAWSVDGVEKAVGDKITVTANTTVKAVWENTPVTPTEYKILDGENSSWTQDSDGSLSVRGSGEFSKFVGVKVDGKSVDKKYYTVKEGSTIVTLKPEYLNTLTAGKHTLEIVWTDGTADTTFTVDAKSANTDTKSPQTGDNSMMWLWIALLFVSGFGVVTTTVYTKKRKSAK